ncbi:MAG: uncharacterized protein A8A55_1812 [Amphiamblys sp. WSBS2006]|nr:MAG: uncharacterized protein A8A55_1812 [Amphiamblys sp. WSBS2006]
MQHQERNLEKVKTLLDEIKKDSLDSSQREELDDMLWWFRERLCLDAHKEVLAVLGNSPSKTVPELLEIAPHCNSVLLAADETLLYFLEAVDFLFAEMDTDEAKRSSIALKICVFLVSLHRRYKYFASTQRKIGETIQLIVGDTKNILMQFVFGNISPESVRFVAEHVPAVAQCCSVLRKEKGPTPAKAEVFCTLATALAGKYPGETSVALAESVLDAHAHLVTTHVHRDELRKIKMLV